MAKYYFRRLVRNWLHADMAPAQLTIGKVEPTDSLIETANSINFRIYSANGGRVIQTNRYDRTQDRNINNLYVVTHEQNIGEMIDKIMTMESLR